MARLDDSRVEVHAEVRHREAVLAVGGEGVAEDHAAARAERQPVDVRGLIVALRLDVVRARHLGHRFAHGQLGGAARRGHVLIEERGGDAERRRDVLEAVDLDLGGQQFGGLELETEQVVDRGGVLGAGQALQGHVAGDRPARGRRVELCFHPADEGVDLALLGLLAAGRRHQPAAKFPDRGLPHLGLLVDGVDRDRVEGDAAGLGARVVAADAVGVERLARLLGAAVSRRRGGALLPALRESDGRQAEGGDADAESPLHG